MDFFYQPYNLDVNILQHMDFNREQLAKDLQLLYQEINHNKNVMEEINRV